MRLNRRLALLLTSCCFASPLLAQNTTTPPPSPGSAAPTVQLSTSMGDIVVQLDPAKAPQTVANFLQYVEDKHYDGTIFHRVIDGFMIQGGGMGPDMQEKATRAPIPLEANNGLKNQRYTIAMARRMQPNSATAQFFINVQDNPNLDAPKPDGHGYAVFGTVVSGQDVVDAIKKVPTATVRFHQDVPKTPVEIRQVRLLP